jgi:vitamin B12/bleomycin/antimicrobial peptide transport system ATP-binding/permease protein
MIVSGLLSTLRIIGRIALPYFRSEDRWAGRVLLAAVVAIELAIVGVNVLINNWNNAFYNALQERDWDAFVYQLAYFCVLAAIFIVLAVYQLYLNQWLVIRWRRWLTQHYLQAWLDGPNHYRMQLLGDAADNPDQRIAEDVNAFIGGGPTNTGLLPLGLGLLNAVVSLASFGVVLWGLSATAPLHLGGSTWSIPGYLVWAALIYSIGGTILTHLIGRGLIRLNFMQQRYEADFRFNLVRVRENSEQIALLEGERAERDGLLVRFASVMANWYAIMTTQKRLTFFTAGYGQIAVIFPYVVLSPAYFAGAVQLGGLMQTAGAFDQVQRSFSFFITAYRSLAEFGAVIERLAGFDQAIATARATGNTLSAVEIKPAETKAIRIDELSLRLPNGAPLVTANELSIGSNERVLISGPSGSGKSTLFRALAGIWPFGNGTITVPKGAKVMMLPQRPYFPVAPLSAAVVYPAELGDFPAERVAAAIKAVGLPALVERLDEEAHWNRMLSLGEQQRLGIARALLHAPDYLFLDEATASLDEASEAALYKLLHERLAGSTIVSIGHRSTLTAFHKRQLKFVRGADGYTIEEAGAAAQ